MILITHGSLCRVCYMQIGLVIFDIVQTLGKLSYCCFSNVVAETAHGTPDFTPGDGFMISPIHYKYITEFVSLRTMFTD